MMTLPIDGQWLDFYALLDVPVGATEDTIRKRVGKVYSEAAANSDHRDLSRRHYSQVLVERVLPQCRRVLLDPEWRAQYDRQHILHSNADPSAQSYVAFIASMRGADFVAEGDNVLPQRLQDDINAAREVVECAMQGTELELLPTQAVSSKAEPVAAPEIVAAPTEPTQWTAPPKDAPSVAVPLSSLPVVEAQPQPPIVPSEEPRVETVQPKGEPVRLQVITAQEAAAIRRRRDSNPDADGFTIPTPNVGDGSLVVPRAKTPNGKKPISRVSVGNVDSAGRKRLLSPTVMNFLVAGVGVTLFIVIQRFGVTPAVATSAPRTPIFVAVASEMESALLRAETAWENTPEGAGFDIVVQPVDSRGGLRRALGTSGQMPDAWIPSASLWAERYNALAPRLKRENIASGQSLVQTPMVLIARAERGAELRRRFPNHQITSWSALREAVATGARSHLGIANPQTASTGSLARVSMAREWGQTRGLSAQQAAQKPEFWRWMAAFEDNAPTAPAQTGAMVKDLVLGTTGRFWWGIAYESDALRWMKAGKALEIYYLPRTTLADHPFCPIERVGAPLEVAQGRAGFEKFLRGDAMQKGFLASGFRPTEISLNTKTSDNPFLSANFRTRGARRENLPRDERPNAAAVEAIAREWGKRFG
ncbi:MAG: substrate-binding domain-containing protein [Armatimonadetes bacterium]|nr:substrate-binding domain-containing protein [Armatimonadota bacterium]